MADKITVWAEYWSEIKHEFGDQNGVGPLIAGFVLWLVGLGCIVFSGDTQSAEKLRLAATETAIYIFANVVALPWFMWKAHSNIAERDRGRISALEVARDDLRISPDTDNAAGGLEQYLRVKIRNPGNGVEGIRAKLIGVRAATGSQAIPDSLDLRTTHSGPITVDIGNGGEAIFDVGAAARLAKNPNFKILGVLGVKEKPVYVNNDDLSLEVEITGKFVKGKKLFIPIKLVRDGDECAIVIGKWGLTAL